MIEDTARLQLRGAVCGRVFSDVLVVATVMALRLGASVGPNTHDW